MQMKVNDAKSRASSGLKDGGHVHLRCSNCNAILLDVWRTNPDAIDPRTAKPFVWKFRANCPFCGDESFVAEITGIFHVGGYGTPKEDDPDDDIPSTSYDPPDIIGDTYHFKIKKANKDAKPVRT